MMIFFNKNTQQPVNLIPNEISIPIPKKGGKTPQHTMDIFFYAIQRVRFLNGEIDHCMFWPM